MKKQTSLLAILLLCLTMTTWAASSIVSVSVGSSEASPALVFGQAEEAKEVPYPPFSGMFGVKDLYLVNPANFDALTVTGDMERLGTDIRSSVADDDYWLLVANSDAKLYFSIEDDGIDAEYEVVFEGAEPAALGESLSVTAGCVYKFYQKHVGVDQDPVTSDDLNGTQHTVFLAKDDDSGVYIGASPALPGKTTRSFTIDVVSTDAPVYLAVLRGENPTQFYSAEGEITEDDTADGWVLCCDNLESTNLVVEYVESTITLTIPAGDSDQDSVILSATTLKGNYKPITTTLSIDDGAKFATVNWVIKQGGTLDFDQDGVVDINDAMYLLNFQEAGCPDESDPFFTADQLAASTEVDDELRLTTALETLRSMGEALDFDEDGVVDINDAMYLLNFQEAGCPDESDPFFTADQLAASTEVDDEARLSTALEHLRSFTPAE